MNSYRVSHHHIEHTYPLSPLQQGMVFHSLYEPDSGVYVEQLVCHLQEDLDENAFHRAWQWVIERHAVLRTSFRWGDLPAPQQEVHRAVTLPFSTENWRDLTEDTQRERLQEYLDRDRQRGFDLGAAPLLRLALFHQGQRSSWWVWTFHHAILDGRSLPLIIQELFACYAALIQGQEIPPLPCPRPYQDYIEWLVARPAAREEHFWRQTLHDFITPTPIVSAVQAPPACPPAMSHCVLRLPQALTAALKAFARQHQLSLTTLVQAAWALLLGRYCDERDVVFGVTRSCRRSSIPGADAMIGMVINTVPLRVALPPDEPVLPWLHELRTRWLALRDYELTALTEIRRYSGVAPGKPLFDSLVMVENYLLNDLLRAAGGPWEHRTFSLLEKTNDPLTLSAYCSDEILLQLHYAHHLFSAETCTRMLGHLQTLLQGMLDDPQQRLDDLPLLTPQELQKALYQWNDITAEDPSGVPGTPLQTSSTSIGATVHEIFEQRVRETPEATAIIFGQQQLSYLQLNARANRLAHRLRCLGVGPEILVAVVMERSLDLVATLLGILKAGGAYVPLDPSYPGPRLEAMLRDCQVPVLVTQPVMSAHLPPCSGAVLCLDLAWSDLAGESEENPPHTTTSENLVYVLYTSGTTGQPKGITVEHRGVTRLVRDTNYIQIRPGDRVAQASTVTFDAATFEIWGALLNGACLIGIDKDVLLSPSIFARQIQEQRIDVLWLTTSLFNQLARAAPQAFSTIRDLLIGGEAVDPGWVRWVLEQGAPRRLLNAYGPTEGTTFSSTFEIQQVSKETTAIPIGRPVSGTELYLLDRALRPVPVGVAGELYIGGRGLARGYLGRPELTAERFIPHPFVSTPGARLYKTGDLGRYRPDGNIEFLGRVDRQIKLRGFRIELADIESTLRCHPAIQECYVTLFDDVHDAAKRLVAYLVTADGALSGREVAVFVGQRLPEYMIPSAFVFLDHLPLTENGKVDRLALPAPGRSRPHLATSMVQPRTPIEEVVAGIWAEVLELEQVGVLDNFFELGGHSLLATQIIARLNELLQVSLPICVLFAGPTIAALSATLLERSDDSTSLEKTAQLILNLSRLSDEEALSLLAAEEAGYSKEVE